jgi:hypothetical protein
MGHWLLLLLAVVALAQQPAQQPPPEPSQIEREQLGQMLALKRVYVDHLGTDTAALQLRDMIIASLLRARLFLVTEDETQADAFLRGSAAELMFTEIHSSREGLQLRASSSLRQRGSTSSNSDGAAASLGVGETESRYANEHKRQAAAALRLVARTGDVLWSTAQESEGSKYNGSSRDVAEKIVKELETTYARARQLRAVPGGP